MRRKLWIIISKMTIARTVRAAPGRGLTGTVLLFMVFLAITVAVLLGMALFNGLMGSSGSEEISYDEFRGMAGQWQGQERRP